MRIFPNIDDQIAALKSDFPSFEVVRREGEFAIWQGTLKPLMRTYTVAIIYRVPMVLERIDLLSMQPRVRVLSPRLTPRRGDPEGDLPHVYWVDGDPIPLLCLFDPDTTEWTPSDLLSRTTVPYTSDWLACYEGWRATGSWTGGGRHAQLLRSSGAAL